MHADLEGLTTRFVKKTLDLPGYAPDYIIGLEASVSSVYLYTLRCNVKHVRKVLIAVDEDRLSNFLSRGNYSRGIDWLSNWNRILWWAEDYV